MILSGGCLGRFLGLLIKNVIERLTKYVLISLGLAASASTADAAIHKKP